MMKIKIIAKAAISFMILAALFTACQTGQQPEKKAKHDEAVEALPVSFHLTPEQMDMAGIELGKPVKRIISNSIGCTGRVEVPPQSLASVYSPVNGFVQSVNHLPGEYVKKGTLLTVLQHPDLVRSQRVFLECRSRLSFLEKEYERKKTLSESDATSKRVFEKTAAELELEKARYKGLKAELKLVGVNTEKLEAGGDIQTSITLVAPISGYIVSVAVNKGKLVSPTDLLYEIVDDSHVHLEIEVFAKDVPKLKKGQTIEAYLPGNDKTYQAKIYLIGKMIDRAKKTVIVHGHFNEEPVPLVPGTYMQARIYMAETEVWAVPETAVTRQGGEAFVFLKNESGFEKIQVETGQSKDGYVALKNGESVRNQLLALKGAYYLSGF